MEPSSAEDGNMFATSGFACRMFASMEPSSAEDGNLPCHCVVRAPCSVLRRFNGAVLS